MNLKNIFPCFSDEKTCDFSLWAPEAKEIRFINLTLEEGKLMDKDECGYWSLTLENCPVGTHYKYEIDNGNSYPDPASLSQPLGVHGPSEIIKLNDFEWSDEGWKNMPLKEMVQYEIHTGTFTPHGNFDGIRKKLDYLVDLGVNTIELLPVSQFSGKRNWGYDGVYPFAVHDSYGGANSLMALVNDCHSRKIAVILDVVYNHFGPEGNYVANFAPYFTGKYATPWGKSLNFDGPYSDGVRNYFIQNALMWCRNFHLDGLRLDAVHAIHDFGARHFMQELSENLQILGRETGKTHYLIAESNLNDVRYISPIEKGGYGLDAQWSDDFHHAIHALTTGERKGYYMDYGEPSQLSKSIKEAFVFDGRYSHFRKRTYGNSTAYTNPDQFVIFSQNHDQIGNRKLGERLISLIGFEMAKLVAGTMFITPNIPMLFMGEEYGERNPFLYFVSHLDKQLNMLVREGREQEFDAFHDGQGRAPDPSAPDTFKMSCLSWDILNNNENQAMFDYYKTLIRLRKDHPVLKFPDKDNIRISEKGNLLMLERWKDNNIILAVLNFDRNRQSFNTPAGMTGTYYRIMDSAGKQWAGPGALSPEKITSGDKIAISGESFTAYTN